MLNSVNFTYVLNATVTIVFSDRDSLIKEFWRIGDVLDDFWSYFHCACAETAIQKLPVKHVTPSFAPATSIFYKTDAFPLPSDVYGIYLIFLCYLVTFDLLSLTLFYILCLTSHIPILIILWLSVSEL